MDTKEGTKDTKASEDVLEEFEKVARTIHSDIEKENQPVFAKYPLTFSLLATLGAASVIYGFEGVVDAIPLIAENPLVLFVGGLVLLLLTGRLYRSLGK